MPIQSVDAKTSNEKTAKERGRNMGDPSEDDAAADAANDMAAGRPNRTRSLDAHGKGVTPIEGTSASNIATKLVGPTCGNVMTGYGPCGGRIDEITGRCEKCQVPTTAETEAAMPMLRSEVGTPNGLVVATDGAGNPVSQALPAHRKEAARHVIRREVAATIMKEEGWEPDALGQYSTTPPHLAGRQREIQAKIDRECERRFRLAGLEPRRAD